MDPRTAPERIEQASADTLRIVWRDGLESLYPVRLLRLACRCARCVEEWSGQPLLDPASVPADVRPERITSVGRYAIQIRWSDGHDSGIYTYEVLRDLARQAGAAAPG